ncbi:MAG: DUF4433 domain-containing protein, partial [bacterium]
IDIGDSQLISQRHDYPVKLPGCGKLGEYVPFYFAGHSPMLLNIKTGFRGITKHPQYEIVYIVCTLENILAHCSEWVFTDGHAKDNLSDHFKDLKDLDKIDWNMVREQYWRNTDDDYDRQRRKQAEFLVRNYVPVACIKKIVVKDNLRKQLIEQTVQKLNLTINVKVDTQNRLYYP